MANVAKGSFPGCLRRKIEKKRVKNFNHRVSSHRWDDNSSTAQQLKKNLRRFCEIFGDSEDDDEFYGFSSEECGLRAYKRVSSSRETVQIPDILCSRIDLNKKKVTTRLEHARSSLDQLPSSKRTRRMKCTLVRRRYSKSKVPIVEGSDALAKPPATLQLADGESTSSDTSGFTKYKNTNLDFHRLSERASFRHSSPASSDHQSSSLKQKKSPLKPATFIAPSLAQHNKHHVTNVTPTCLKIKINPNDAAGPGHPQVLAKALLARANKRSKKPKISDRELPLHTSTPIGSFSSRSKTRLFVLPTKSSRSSRIIKANPRYLDSDADISKESIIASRPSSPAIEPLQSETKKEVKEESSAKGRPLLKEPTFRVAALASINNKPQTSRLLNKNNNINTRIRARKLIKRARFKHPTSSSTLVVGNDFDDAVDKKRNLIREATFKMPSKSQTETSAAENERSDLSDLGLSTQTWEKIVKNEINYKGEAPNWTKQEIHNLLHGAHTFANSWTRVARHYEYHPLHKDWQSVKAKLNSLQSYGLLSGNLKVKSSVLLQLKHRYSETPNVTVFSQRELRMRGMENNVECDVGEGGRLKSRTDESDKVEEESPDLRDQDPIALKQRHIQLYREWSESKSSEPPSSSSVYLGLGKKAFMSMCVSPRSTSKKISWSVREIHNILHGIHIFGVSEWSIIHTNYVFQKAHDNVEIRMKFRSIKSKSLVSSGKVKDEVLPLLQPLLSPAGKKYFGLSSRKGRINSPKPKKRQPLTEVSKKNQKISTKKRLSSADADLSSPPRKQAYHLFGTAPVWDDSGSASGLQSLGDTQSDAEEDDDFVQQGTSMTELFSQKSSGKSRRRSSKDGGRSRKDSIGSSISRKNRSHSEDGGTVVATRGPRIKHVCRRASLVTGHKLAVYSDDGSDLHLSALPKKERQKIAAEVEKLRRVPSDSTISSDSEDEVVNSNISKQMTKKKERSLRTIKKKSDRVANKTRCNSCKNCKIPECGDCDHCRGRSPANSCPERPQCLNPPSSIATKESNKKSTGSEKRSSTPLPQEEKRKTCSPRLQEQQPVLRKNSASSGIILSPDSRRQLQQELQEQARKLPSIVKIDQWKERYELKDLWKTGGVSIITSTTPSTAFLCFLCGSVGRTRPMRRMSGESDSSLESCDNYEQKPLFIVCCSCCEPFHPFCLDDHEQQPAIAKAKKGNWICKRCQFCNVCGRPDDLLECKRCNKTYHSDCLGPGYPTKPSKNRVWVCMRCVRCRSCGASKPGKRPGSKWTHDFQLCQRCGDLFDKGNFCPICRRCYRDEDYESRMIQCATCKRWVHSRCESLTNEMYALLSHLPDDVQYVCPDCDGRRTKIEMEFNNSDNTLTDESGNDSLEGDKMKSMLCKLPSPSWKKILEDEVQSGIEDVMMALFYNKEAACILKRSVAQEESTTGRPIDLFAVRFAVHNCRYSSVGQFSSDVCSILDTITDSDTSDTQGASQGKSKPPSDAGPRSAFCKKMQQVFPWFDIETGRVRDTSDVPEDLLPHATLPPYTDHNYAQWQDRDIDISVIGPDTPLKNFNSTAPAETDNVGMIIWTGASLKEFEDRRICLFCGKYGDDIPTNAGRLVYCGQDEWVHVNCALWSAEVFERHDGSLQNVYSAVSRGRMMKCELCKLPGATVGCNTRDCAQNYHFACAKLAHCSFQDDKKVFCAKHIINIDSELVPDEGFEVARRVVVDSDEMRPNRRWQRGVLSENVTILMGSAIVHQLGHLAMSSDSKDYLIPVHFRMTRMFWSTTHAGRRVRYTITVTEQKSVFDTPANIKNLNSSKEKTEHHGNHTISHTDEEPLNRHSAFTSRYPKSAACKSNLIGRLQAVEPKVLERRKSYDEPGPELPRSRRHSGPSYSVVGACNRTLPQIITPLPSELRTTTSKLSTSPRVSTISSTVTTIVDSEQDCQSMNSIQQREDLDKGAVPISYKNPYLNIKIGAINQTSNPTNSIVDPGILKAIDECFSEASTFQIQRNTEPAAGSRIGDSTSLNSGSSGAIVAPDSHKLFQDPLPQANETALPVVLATVHDRNTVMSQTEIPVPQCPSVLENCSESDVLNEMQADLRSEAATQVTCTEDQATKDLTDPEKLSAPTTPLRLEDVVVSDPEIESGINLVTDHENQKMSGESNVLNTNVVGLKEAASTVTPSVPEHSEHHVERAREGVITGECQIATTDAPSQKGIDLMELDGDERRKMEVQNLDVPNSQNSTQGTSEHVQDEFLNSNDDAAEKPLSSENAVEHTMCGQSDNDKSQLNIVESAPTCHSSTLPQQAVMAQTQVCESSGSSTGKDPFSGVSLSHKTKHSLKINLQKLDDEIPLSRSVSLLQRVKVAHSKVCKPQDEVEEQLASKSIGLLWQAKQARTSELAASENISSNSTACDETPDPIKLWWKCSNDKRKKLKKTRRLSKTTIRKRRDSDEYIISSGDDETETIGHRMRTRSDAAETIAHRIRTRSKQTKLRRNSQNHKDSGEENHADLKIEEKETNEASNLLKDRTKKLQVLVHDLKEGVMPSKIQLKPVSSPVQKAGDNIVSACTSPLNFDKKDELFSDIARVGDGYSSSVETSSVSDVPFSNSEEKPHTRRKNLRNFAKNLNHEGAFSNKTVRNTPRTRSSKRHFSHDSTVRRQRNQTINEPVCNGNHCDNASVDKSPVRVMRLRSKSVDSTNIKKKLFDKVHDDKDLVTDGTQRRYPRRNPFTCLRSFSGLSPNYAIQSYSSRNQDPTEKPLNKSIGKAQNKKTHKHKTPSRARNVSFSSDDMTNSSSPEKISSQTRSRSKFAEVKKSSKKKKAITTNSVVVLTETTSPLTHVKSPPSPWKRKYLVGSGRCGIKRSKSNERNRDKIFTKSFLERLKDVSQGSNFNDSSSSGGDGNESKSVDDTEQKVSYMTRSNSKSHCVLRSSSKKSSTNVSEDVSGTKECNAVCQDENHDANSDNECTSKSQETSSFDPGTLELPPIETERGVIEVNAANPKPVTVDPSDPDLIQIEEDSVPSSAMVNSPIPLRDLHEINDDVNASKDDSQPSHSQNTTSVSEMPILSKENKISGVQHVPANMAMAEKLRTFAEKSREAATASANVTHSFQGAVQLPPGIPFDVTVEDIESPLSPRDEQRLPLPVETEATASSFLVTSECPVLNADEVQSILSMPTVTTAAIASTVPQPTAVGTTITSVSQLQKFHGQPLQTNSPTMFAAPLGSSYIPQTNLIQQQYVPICIPNNVSPYQQHSRVLMNYGANGAVYVYGQQPAMPEHQYHRLACSNKTVISSSPSVTSPVIAQSQQLSYQYVQPQLLVQTPVVRSPALVQQTMYVATPVVRTVSGIAVAVPTPPIQYAVPHKSTSKHGSVSRKSETKRPKKPKPVKVPTTTTTSQMPISTSAATAAVAAVTSTSTITSDSGRMWNANVTPDQVNTLEKMIEFYSNKNKLSANEKQIVRAIIAQQIQNKSLPLPTPENLQVASGCNKTVSQNKRKSSSAASSEMPSKRQKRSRKETKKTLLVQEPVPDSNNPGQYAKATSEPSPLLDIYMKALHAENSTSDKSLGRWREIIRNLTKRRVHIDVPWYSRRGARDKENKLPPPPQNSKHSELVYEIKSEDGYHAKGSDLNELVSNLLDAVQECRSNAYVPPSSLCLASVISPYAFLGVSHDAIRFLVEQLPGARHCQRYKAKYHKHKEPIPEVVTHINPHGCARAEKYQGRSKPDTFSFLASKHRVPPTYDPSQTQNIDMQQNSTRRPTSMDLPMAMRFRHLKTSAREAVGVYRSAIHGRGLFCKRDIEAGEMVMEYTGEAIRCFLTDRREKLYESRGIGCYMFRMDDMYVVDATMMGSGARFINHSCEPSCYSRIVSIDGKKHIIIFALRKILRGEELTYDYKFPIEAEDQKIMCNCGAKTCRKYMN